MRTRTALLLATSALLLAAAPSTARCLSYAPTQVTLRGELRMRTLPGPPLYKSIARGDRPENIYFLALPAPICVTGNPTSTLNPRSHAGLVEIQLVMPPEQGRRLVGTPVRATGPLLGAQSGAQRTPVVMSVKALVSDD